MPAAAGVPSPSATPPRIQFGESQARRPPASRPANPPEPPTESGLMSSLMNALTERRWLTIWVPALLAFAISALPTLWKGIPEPVIEDEWGYLLTADTFAEGRLANPTHEHWDLMEAVHQFHVPTYNSKYPPGQSLFLALGQVLWEPILGVWISAALMVAAIVWMLLGIFPARWALIGGFLAASQYLVLGVPFKMGTFGYWSQSYWGGCVAAMGGALVFGALPRLRDKPSVSASVWMGIGLLWLANTRPMEGLLAALPAAGVVVWIMAKHRFGAPVWLKIVAPTLLVLAPGFVAMGAHNKAVTGDALELPWNTHYEQYCIFPLFIWQDLLPDKEWRHKEMAVFHGEVEGDMHKRHGTLKGLATTTANKIARFGIFYIGPIFVWPLLLCGWGLLRIGWARFAIGTIVLVFGSALIKFGNPPHYSAPILGLVVALLVQCLISLEARFAKGRLALHALLLVAWGGIAFGIVQSAESNFKTQRRYRHQFAAELEAKPGLHLAVIRFGEYHTRGDHWIWNDADIDRSKVVWIRDPGEARWEAMLADFPDRDVWRIDVGYLKDNEKPPLVPVRSALEGSAE